MSEKLSNHTEDRDKQMSFQILVRIRLCRFNIEVILSFRAVLVIKEALQFFSLTREPSFFLFGGRKSRNRKEIEKC